MQIIFVDITLRDTQLNVFDNDMLNELRRV